MPIKKFEPELDETYVISSGEYDSLEEVARIIALWQKKGTLSTAAKVYEVKRTYPIVDGKVYAPIV